MNKTDETFDFWNNLQIKAKENMLRHEKNGNGVLIEVAAQHPLIDGLFPNEEFEKRLQTAIELYRENKAKGISTKIYVPGSLHMDKGVADKRSLSSFHRFLHRHFTSFLIRLHQASLPVRLMKSY